jgi:hypothetical protein
LENEEQSDFSLSSEESTEEHSPCIVPHLGCSHATPTEVDSEMYTSWSEGSPSDYPYPDYSLDTTLEGATSTFTMEIGEEVIQFAGKQ